MSIAYRLGAYGFLAHPELTREGGKGNFGLRDQIAGLEWVRDNIAVFGGDAKKVTRFGESAGGISVSLLVKSPKAKGLFQRAIAESGAAFFPPKRAPGDFELVASMEDAEKQGEGFLSGLGVKDIAAARALSAKTIRDTTFTPAACYDDDLVLRDQQAIYEQRQFNDTPILVGFNSDDGGMFVFGGKKPIEFDSDVRKGLGDFAEKVLAAYPHATLREANQAARDLVRDGFFAWPTCYWARLQTEYGAGKAFVYYYDHRAANNPNGAGHAAELAYVFQNLEKEPRPEDTKMSELISSYWVNFAKTGNPNGSSLPEWRAFKVGESDAMILDAAPRMAPLPNSEQLKILDEYFGWRRGNAGGIAPRD